jgi:hypothetical protein
LVISRRQEAYLRDSEPLPVSAPTNVSPVPIFRGDGAVGGREGSFEGRADAGGVDVGEDSEHTRLGGGG